MESDADTMWGVVNTATLVVKFPLGAILVAPYAPVYLAGYDPAAVLGESKEMRRAAAWLMTALSAAFWWYAVKAARWARRRRAGRAANPPKEVPAAVGATP